MSLFRIMRTGSVLIGWQPFGMEYMISETLVRDRQRQLADAAANYRLARQLRAVWPAPVRVRAGWMMVRAGLRLSRAGATPREPAAFGTARAH